MGICVSLISYTCKNFTVTLCISFPYQLLSYALIWSLFPISICKLANVLICINSETRYVIDTHFTGNEKGICVYNDSLCVPGNLYFANNGTLYVSDMKSTGRIIAMLWDAKHECLVVKHQTIQLAMGMYESPQVQFYS